MHENTDYDSLLSMLTVTYCSVDPVVAVLCIPFLMLPHAHPGLIYSPKKNNSHSDKSTGVSTGPYIL